VALIEKSSIAATTVKRVAGRFLIVRKRITHPGGFDKFCRPLRISAVSALKLIFNAEDAEIRRGPQRNDSLLKLRNFFAPPENSA
jgi:hypothetical protein